MSLQAKPARNGSISRACVVDPRHDHANHDHHVAAADDHDDDLAATHHYHDDQYDHHDVTPDDHDDHGAAGRLVHRDVPGGRHAVAGWFPGGNHRAGRIGRGERLDRALDQPDRAGRDPALGRSAHGERSGVHRGRDVMERHVAPNGSVEFGFLSYAGHSAAPSVSSLTCT